MNTVRNGLVAFLALEEDHIAETLRYDKPMKYTFSFGIIGPVTFLISQLLTIPLALSFSS